MLPRDRTSCSYTNTTDYFCIVKIFPTYTLYAIVTLLMKNEITHASHSQMFTDKLYDHKFDVDDIIKAFCGKETQGKWILDSRHAEVLCVDETNALYQAKDGDDNGHIHIITPLPLTFLNEMKTHYTLDNMQAADKQRVLNQFETMTCMSELTEFMYNNGYAGGWVRERIKEAVLEWLDMWEMIPPSMRHVRDGSMLSGFPDENLNPNKNVKIEIK